MDTAVQEPINLNLGARETKLPGFIPIDRSNGQEAYPLAYPDDSVDRIYASHILEHFSHRDTVKVVQDWVRALKPGGTIKISVPDFDWIIAAYNNEVCATLPIEAYLFGAHSDSNDFHGAMFNRQKLTQIMEMCGLEDIESWKSDIEDCASMSVSLNLMGTKPLPGESTATLKGIHAIVSIGRLGFTDTFNCMMQTLPALGVPVEMSQGVYWFQQLTGAMQKCIDNGAEYILTIDGDSVFEAKDVRSLLRLMKKNPHADAVCATQVGRERDTVLLTIKENERANKREVHRNDVDEPLIKLNTGHFGLTLIRVASLKKLPKPWMVHKPSPARDWGDGRVDFDIDFWQNWERTGLTLYQANKVRIGHLQLMVTWPTADLEPIHQYVGTYHREGKP